MQNETISILGCGWLGLHLGLSLIEKGYLVKGSTTSEQKLNELSKKKINPYLIQLNPLIENERTLEEFLKSEILIINIPPGTKSKPTNFHIEQIDNLIPFILKSPVKKIIYVSSTSVYPDLNRIVKEDDVTSFAQAENKILAVAENRLQLLPNKSTTIIRLGGLTGYNRLLIKHFAGKQNLTFGHEPVNLIHRDDAIGLIHAVLQKNLWGKTFNACSPEHPIKKDFYTYLADKYSMDRPTFLCTENQSFKVVDCQKIIQETGYTFLYADPMKYTYDF